MAAAWLKGVYAQGAQKCRKQSQLQCAKGSNGQHLLKLENVMMHCIKFLLLDAIWKIELEKSTPYWNIRSSVKENRSFSQKIAKLRMWENLFSPYRKLLDDLLDFSTALMTIPLSTRLSTEIWMMVIYGKKNFPQRHLNPLLNGKSSVNCQKSYF